MFMINEINKIYWAYIKLISENEIFLSREGRILKQILLQDGKCKSMTCIARKLKTNKTPIREICNKLQMDGFIFLKKEGNRKSVCFHKEALKNGEKMIKEVLKYEN